KPPSSPPEKDSPPPEKRLSAPAGPGRAVVVGEDRRDTADHAEAQIKKQFGEILKDEGLAILRIVRKPDRVMAEIQLTDLKPTVARLTDFGLKMWLQESGGAAAKPRVRFNDHPPRDR